MHQLKVSKSVKNETNEVKEVKIPELEIDSFWEKIIDRVSHIHRIYWILALIVMLVLFVPMVPNYVWVYFWDSIKAQKIVIVLLAVFAFVALSLIWSIGQQLDVLVFMYFNMHGKRGPRLDTLMLAVTQIGNFVFAMFVAFLLYLSGNHIVAYELILGTMILGLVVQLMKTMIHRTRPYIKLKNIRIVGSRASGQSFPSGHTSQAFFIATVLISFLPQNLYQGILFYLIATIVGITRIYVGMHYPRDVIGGAMLGTVMGLFGVIINNYIFMVR